MPTEAREHGERLRDRAEGALKRRYEELLHHGVSMKAALAELLGTAGVVLLGCAVASFVNYVPPHSAEAYLPRDLMLCSALVAMGFALAYTVFTYMTAHTSGGHLNPAVSLAMCCSGVTPLWQACTNIVAQILGALIGALVLRLVIPHRIVSDMHLGINIVPDESHWARAFIGEIVGTLVIVLVILEVSTHPKSRADNAAALVAGLAYFVTIFALGPVSSASFNPARSLGPAIMSGHMGHIAIYIFGPLLGALAAVPFHLASVSDLDTQIAEVAGRAGMPESTQEALLPSSNRDAGVQ